MYEHYMCQYEFTNALKAVKYHQKVICNLVPLFKHHVGDLFLLSVKEWLLYDKYKATDIKIMAGHKQSNFLVNTSRKYNK